MRNSLRTTLEVTVLGFGLACSAGCGSRPAALFPASGEVSGWDSAGKIRSFDAANLWQYLDGGAEKYLQAGVERALTTEYRYQDGLEAVADIYVMATGEGAKAILESEAAPNSRRTELGDECRLYSNSVVFKEGRYLVRLNAYRDEPNAGTALVLLGRGIEQRIKRQK